MKIPKILIITLMNLLLITSAAFAGDFDWERDFNISAKADPSGFRARLEARFKLRGIDISAVLTDSDKPSDAYILFRLGEISNRPMDQVLQTYKSRKGKGWGVFARSLGIKPGSGAFHDLKKSQDLYIERGKSSMKHKDKGKSKGKGRG